jgi:hypothetical protein
MPAVELLMLRELQQQLVVVQRREREGRIREEERSKEDKNGRRERTGTKGLE